MATQVRWADIKDQLARFRELCAGPDEYSCYYENNDRTGYPLRFRGYYFRFGYDGRLQQLARQYRSDGHDMIEYRRITLPMSEYDLSLDCNVRQGIWTDRDNIEDAIRSLLPIFRRMFMKPVKVYPDGIAWESLFWSVEGDRFFARPEFWSADDRIEVRNWRDLKYLLKQRRPQAA